LRPRSFDPVEVDDGQRPTQTEDAADTFGSTRVTFSRLDLNHQPLLSWLHISDLHIRDDHGSGRLEIARLIDDLKNRDAWYKNEFEEWVGPPAPTVVFVSGDLAYSGDARGRREYAATKRYLEKLCQAISVPTDRVFMVPGNHDVHRGALDSDQVPGARTNPESSDVFIQRRFQNYLTMSSHFAYVEKLGDCGSWRADIQGAGNAPIRVVGLNTALISGMGPGEDEPGGLRLDERTREAITGVHAPRQRDGITIVLMHHPASWLNQMPNLGNGTIVLHGHTHEPGVARVESGNNDTITVISGAVRLHGKSGTGFERLGYNAGAIYSDDDAYRIKIWPRSYHSKDPREDGQYYLDVVNVPSGSYFKRFRWGIEGESKPSTRHKHFGGRALRGENSSPEEPTKIWIAAHSAWHTFRPTGGSSAWDARLFGAGASLGPGELDGDIWKPLVERIKRDSGERLAFKILLAHPYGVEARCVRRNQVIEEPDRHAEKDFFRTLKALQLLPKLSDSSGRAARVLRGDQGMAAVRVEAS
jgi:predicted MPP superfamily phosphohydrolase